MFKSRLELISYVIQAITDASREECDKLALKYDDKPYIVRITCD
jgi:hypothetical protein